MRIGLLPPPSENVIEQYLAGVFRACNMVHGARSMVDLALSLIDTIPHDRAYKRNNQWPEFTSALKLN